MARIRIVMDENHTIRVHGSRKIKQDIDFTISVIKQKAGVNEPFAHSLLAQYIKEYFLIHEDKLNVFFDLSINSEYKGKSIILKGILKEIRLNLV